MYLSGDRCISMDELGYWFLLVERVVTLFLYIVPSLLAVGSDLCHIELLSVDLGEKHQKHC